MSNLVKVEKKKKSIWQFFLQMLGFTSNEAEAIVVEPIDPRKEYVRSSVKKIHLLSNILKCDEFVINDTVTAEQSQVFADILEVIKKVHSRIESDSNITPERLEQFHMYYTDNLITLLSQLKNVREDVRDIHVNPEPYIRKALNYRDSLISQTVKEATNEHEKALIERYGDVIGMRMIRQQRDQFAGKLAAGMDRRIFYIKNSKEVERCPIFYSMGHLYKVFYDEDGEIKTKKLVINEGFKVRIEEAKNNNDDNFANIRLTKQKVVKVDYFSLTQEQYGLMVEFKDKISEFYTNLDGKKERIKLEMDNLKSILKTDMLDLG